MLLWLIGCFQISEKNWSAWKDEQPCFVNGNLDRDCDGFINSVDCDDEDSNSFGVTIDADCDGVLTADDCNDNDPSLLASAEDGDCDGVLTTDDCDDNDANTVNDMDCDGVLTADDCDDNDANTVNDMDCDGVLMADDCNDGDENSTTVAIDGDCDGVLTAEDCDDSAPNLRHQSNDNDCDGVLTVDDCDDDNDTMPNQDEDCDGVLTADDCDDENVNSTTIAADGDCDGVLTADDCNDEDSSSTIVAEDENCDGIRDFCALTNCDTSLDLGGGQGIDLVLIPAGSDPLGRYTLTNDFYLMTTEVTQGMFSQIMGYQPYEGKNADDGAGENYPAYHSSWHMAADFANQLTQHHNSLHGTSLQECYSCADALTTSVSCTEAVNPYQCNGYVLPTEAEWEYAARSGTTSDFWTSNGGGSYSSTGCDGADTIQDGSNPEPLLRDYAWYCGNNDNAYGADGAKEVAQKLPNGFGLYDMHGNLYEWSTDGYGCIYPSISTNPYCALDDSYRVLRGGHWWYSPNNLGASYRNEYLPTSRSSNIGYRIALHP